MKDLEKLVLLGLTVAVVSVLGRVGTQSGVEDLGSGDEPAPRRTGVRYAVLASHPAGEWISVDVHASEAPLEAAKACVSDYRGAADGVSCYAFLSPDDRAAARPSTAGNFQLTCFAARWTRNKLGEESGGMNMRPPACTDGPGKSLTAEPPAVGNRLGGWETHEPGFASRFVLVERNASAFLKQTFPDGSSRELGVVESPIAGGRRFTDPRNRFGEYWVLRGDRLELWDPEGVVFTAEAMR